MGGSDYSFSSRKMRTSAFTEKDAKGNFKVTTDAIFEQTKHRKAHESMLPNAKNKAQLRESRDSAAHPNSVPILIVLDITGSMGDIPEHLIREGLPKMVSKIMELGIKDPQIMMMAVGDSRCDRNDGVFQIGQFESGDVEMDLWLQRIWISEGGGGNGGESYNWAYLYAKDHIKTDAWEKRQQKGFIFTIGDDHCHKDLSSREIEEYMGEIAITKETVHTQSLVDGLKDQWHVYHMELNRYDTGVQASWETLLGKENVIKCGRNDYEGMGNKIAEIVASFTGEVSKSSVTPKSEPAKQEEQIGKTEDTKIKPML